MDTPLGSSVHGALQARILEWVAMPSSRISSDPGIKPLSPVSPALAGSFFAISTAWEALLLRKEKCYAPLRASQVALVAKKPPGMQDTRVWPLGGEEPLEEEMATHSSILAWKIPWTEEPGGLQSLGLQRVRCNLATKIQSPTPRVTRKIKADIIWQVSSTLRVVLLGLLWGRTTDWGASTTQLCGLEVQDQGVGRGSFSWDLFPWLVDGHLLSVPSHRHLSSCVACFFSYKETSHIR